MLELTLQDPCSTYTDRSGDNLFDVYDGFDYLGNNRAVVEVTDTVRKQRRCRI